MPRLISSPFNAAASGKFWIEQASGAVVRSQLQMSAPNVTATITVTYERQFEPPIWLPASMVEEYGLVNGTMAISGLATYSNFRRFRVDVASEIKSEADPLK